MTLVQVEPATSKILSRRLPARRALARSSDGEAMMVPTSTLERSVTICIKHTSRFPRRREMLQSLLQSIRERHGSGMRILIADDGGAADSSRLWGAELIALPPATGLSAGRNALVSATHTPYLAMLDDDVFFHNATRLDVLLAALLRNGNETVLAAGCYTDSRFTRDDCFNLRFEANEGGSVVRALPERGLRGCQQTHATHNFFVAHVAALRRFRWDPRQKVMEHESFFYQLFLNRQKVLACVDVSVRHNTTRDDQYRERSFRLQERRFMQYHCKNFPELARFETPYLLWRCDTRTYCSPAWHAQFAYDGRECKPMQWAVNDDLSAVPRPLISPAIDSLERFTNGVHDDGRATGVAGGAASRAQVPLLVLIFTEARHAARRQWQRDTWLSFKWHRSYLEHELVPWRHVFVMSRDATGDGSRALDEEQMDVVIGDTVTLGNTTEGYANLVFKTMEALRWALSHVSFEVLLKVDDDSIVHVGRLWSWIYSELPKTEPWAPRPTHLYAGRVFRGSQVIRSNFTRASLWRPDWFPSSFKKWAVGFDVFPEAAYPPYCGGGGYVLGSEAVERIMREYDSRYHASKIIQVEDAFIGVLARAQGIVAKDLLTFQEPPRGSLQTREMFIDQVLVHRVLEPYKAFRWLMLSSNCHAGARACELQRNRTRGLSSQGSLSTSPDSEENRDDATGVRFDKDWISSAIPKAHPEARTGSLPYYDAPRAESGLRLGAPTTSQSRQNRGGRKRDHRGSKRHARDGHRGTHLHRSGHRRGAGRVVSGD